MSCQYVQLEDDGHPDHVECVYVNYFSDYHLEEPTKFKKSQAANHNQPSGIST